MGRVRFKNRDEMGAVTLQRRLERTVLFNRPLSAAAKQAFRSFIRAYATHSSDTKGIFQVQQLHLGHVAKSFALRDKPTALKCHEDFIGKIFNGQYAQPRNGGQTSPLDSGSGKGNSDKLEKRKIRDEKFSASASLKRQKLTASDGNGIVRGTGGTGGTVPPRTVLKKGKDRQQLRKMSRGAGVGVGVAAVRSRDKTSRLRPLQRSSSGSVRKKIRAQSNAEFSIG